MKSDKNCARGPPPSESGICCRMGGPWLSPPTPKLKTLIEEMSHGTNLSRRGNKLKKMPQPTTVRVFDAAH